MQTMYTTILEMTIQDDKPGKKRELTLQKTLGFDPGNCSWEISPGTGIFIKLGEVPEYSSASSGKLCKIYRASTNLYRHHTQKTYDELVAAAKNDGLAEKATNNKK